MTLAVRQAHGTCDEPAIDHLARRMCRRLVIRAPFIATLCADVVGDAHDAREGNVLQSARVGDAEALEVLDDTTGTGGDQRAERIVGGEHQRVGDLCRRGASLAETERDHRIAVDGARHRFGHCTALLDFDGIDQLHSAGDDRVTDRVLPGHVRRTCLCVVDGARHRRIRVQVESAGPHQDDRARTKLHEPQRGAGGCVRKADAHGLACDHHARDVAVEVIAEQAAHGCELRRVSSEDEQVDGARAGGRVHRDTGSLASFFARRSKGDSRPETGVDDESAR